MPFQTLQNVPWSRFHDPRDAPIRPDVPAVQCADGPEALIAICAGRAPDRKLKAAGSHWALSRATVSDGDAVETHWPGTQAVPRNTGLALDLATIINDQFVEFLVANPPVPPDAAVRDPCLDEGLANAFYVHLKSGTRIYEAYSLLDQMDQQPTELAAILNRKLAGGPHVGAYDGPWAFATLGGAGGQTVFGALTTGTHGGDYFQRPVSDAVAAMHLVTDGGDHVWIEPSRRRREILLTDDDKLHAAFDGLSPDARFTVVRDDDMFDAVAVGVGRFGVVSSLVLRVVPQYCLLEHRRLDNWSNVKTFLNGPARHHAFDAPYFPSTNPASASDRDTFRRRFGENSAGPNRFLQIALNVSPHQRDDHRCGVSQRWFFPSSAAEARNPDGSLRGREERGTAATAGASHSYEPPDDPGGAGSSNGTFISKACAEGNFIAGVLRQIGAELEQVIADGVVSPAGGAIAAAIAVGAGEAVLATAATLCAALVAIAEALKVLADAVDGMGDASLAQTVDAAIGGVRDIPGVPDSLKIMAIRVVLFKAFESQQSNRDMVALSYAVMDTHDYFDRSCFGNAESLEVFFDAARPDLYCAFVDQILAFEAAQEEQRFQFTVGYVSLRFMRGSRALIAPAQFAETVAIEVSGIRDAAGTIPFVMNAAAVARNPMYGALFHWGQFNPLTRAEVDRLYDAAPANRLQRWRIALQKLTQDGTLDGFSSDFTRQTGLEPF